LDEPGNVIEMHEHAGDFKHSCALTFGRFVVCIHVILISEEIKGEAEAVALICPLISEEMSDSEQALEAAVVDVENAAELLSLVTAAAFGKWRPDRNILLTKTKRLGVQSTKDIPAMLDGERVNLGKSAEIDFVSKAVKVLVPAK